jgi:hypothetical protein
MSQYDTEDLSDDTDDLSDTDSDLGQPYYDWSDSDNLDDLCDYPDENEFYST